MNRFCLFLLFLSVADISNGYLILPHSTIFILNGTKAEKGQFPFMVSIRYGGDHNCGGAIIDDRWILTAAHCAKKEYVIDLLSVEAGSNNLQAGTVYAVELKIPHPDWDSRANINDIALLKLDRDIDFSKDLVEKIPLVGNNENVPEGAPITVAGWGYTKYSNSVASPHLLFTHASVVGEVKCQEQWTSTVITKEHLCAQNHKYHSGTCLGDSGSPYVHDGKVIGVHSYGDWCKVEKPGVATNVIHFLPWIQEQKSLNPNKDNDLK